MKKIADSNGFLGATIVEFHAKNVIIKKIDHCSRCLAYIMAAATVFGASFLCLVNWKIDGLYIGSLFVWKWLDLCQAELIQRT